MKWEQFHRKSHRQDFIWHSTLREQWNTRNHAQPENTKLESTETSETSPPSVDILRLMSQKDVSRINKSLFKKHWRNEIKIKLFIFNVWHKAFPLLSTDKQTFCSPKSSWNLFNNLISSQTDGSSTLHAFGYPNPRPNPSICIYLMNLAKFYSGAIIDVNSSATLTNIFCFPPKKKVWQFGYEKSIVHSVLKWPWLD